MAATWWIEFRRLDCEIHITAPIPEATQRSRTDRPAQTVLLIPEGKERQKHHLHHRSSSKTFWVLRQHELARAAHAFDTHERTKERRAPKSRARKILIMLMNVDTPEWRAVTGLTTQQQTPSPEFYEEQQEQRYDSWMRAASRHAKIVALVRGLASDDCCASCGPNNDRFDSEQMSDLKQQQQQQLLPFHPLHCAASQGMTTAGRLLLQWYSSNNQVKMLRILVCTAGGFEQQQTRVVYSRIKCVRVCF